MGTDIEKLVDLMIQERMQSQFAKWREAETGTEKKEDCLRLENEYEKAISALSENSYQKYIATTIASDVSEESVAYVSENASKLQGVEVIDDTIRKYNDAEYFASIIGYTGKISTEEYESLSADNGNYTLNDVVGKAGIEQVMDASLQGTKGYEKLYVDYLGKAVEVLERVERRKQQNQKRKTPETVGLTVIRK